nr:MBL fold metallo-hydrolase [uncultured Blautia sp.]
MKLTVLVDNNTYIDQYYLGEPAVSYYIEIDDMKILFDTGYSHICIQNAGSMGIDLNSVTHIVLSHGYNDHSRGLKYLREQYALPNARLVAHPLCFQPKYYENEYIGAPYSPEDITRLFCYQPAQAPVSLSEDCLFLGQIPELYSFEKRKAIGTSIIDGTEREDFCPDDSALVCRTDKGLFIITGCSHSGICSITEYARRVCREQRVTGIIGGFHLFDKNAQLTETIHFLEALSADTLYPCHCVSLKAKAEMLKCMDIEEVGVGLTIQI